MLARGGMGVSNCRQYYGVYAVYRVNRFFREQSSKVSSLTYMLSNCYVGKHAAVYPSRQTASGQERKSNQKRHDSHT